MRTIVLGMLIFGMGTSPADAAGSCAMLAARQTPASRKSDAAMVARQGKQTVAVTEIGEVLIDGDWRLVWATPKDAERGVYFFHRTKHGFNLVDTWGGVLAPGERGDGIAWARKLKGGGTSLRLAGCFADAVVAGK